jgi:hypothetical protein
MYGAPWFRSAVASADPTADIRNTRRIRWVMQAGRLLDRDTIKAVLTHR